MNEVERALLAALTDISGIGDSRAYTLYTHFHNPLELTDPPKSLIDDFYYVDTDMLVQLNALDEAITAYRRQFEEYASEGITVLGIEDERYPESVRDGPAPVLLYAKGNLDLLRQPAVGVSGSRETNEAGQQWIRSLASDLAEDGYPVISGGARGTDTAAHQGALESIKSTTVVLGTGVNVAYPPENASLFDRIVDADGLLLSMRTPEAEPTRHSFLNRNELIAALSDGMVFVATDGNGGTMAQYETAVEQNCSVFLPPRNLGIEPSTGISELRNTSNTTVVEMVSDIQDALPDEKQAQTNLDEWK